MKKVWLILMLCSSFASAEPLKWATEATYPPFEMIDENGEVTGFDVDIAKALCTQIKAECTFSNQAFDSLIPSLQIGKFDAIIAAIGVTEERAQQVAFTDSYYEPSAVFVASSDKHYQLKDVAGKAIGVQTGSTFQSYLKNKYADQILMKSYASIQDAFLDLAAGRIDMVIADTPIAAAWLKASDNAESYSIVEKPVVDPTYFGTGYGIAVSKSNPALLRQLNAALQVIKKNGTYQAILKRYF